MAKKLPIDFEQKIKQAPPADGKGYPYQLPMSDLMANFKYLLGLIPEGVTKGDVFYWDGSTIQILGIGTAGQVLSVTSNLPAWEDAASGLPSGSAGDMLYHNGTDWQSLSAPSAPDAGEIVILTHDGTTPAWASLYTQDLDICDSGTPSTVTVLVQ